MSIIVLQHSDVGTTGRLGVTLRDHGYLLDIRRPDLKDRVPADLDDVHGVVILGGPQNVTDIAGLAWMQQEAELIKKATAAGVPVIGICLGAQLIAHALGGQVAPREKPSIGFATLHINTTGQVETMLSGMAWDHPQLFSCGQEIKQLPAGAQLLAGADGIKHVIFRAGIRTYGFINHFECDREMITVLMKGSEREMAAAGTTPGGVAADADKSYAAYARQSDRLCVNIATYAFPLRRRMSA
ncbi:MAG: type 1 glutamine amidotransferase [Phycisphaerales bacterium]|nr:type 1 glutamine amidotransferase [Phycisphaerales bacterium]